MAPGSKGEVDDARKLEGNAEPDPDDLDTLFEYIDEKHGYFINRLRDFVEFRTVSSDPTKKDEFPRMAEFVVGILRKFGIRSTVMNMIETEENDVRAEGDVVPLILAETEIDPTRRTVLFYSHYDVHPINYPECWVDPFELAMTQDDSELHGKGTSAGKGPLLCVINAIGAYQKMKIPLPVNVKIILDPMGTVDGDLTGKFLRRIETDFFVNVDSVCLCTGKWLGTTRPCVSHGSRGLCHFTVEVEGPSRDLHSGSYGGLFNEPIADLIFILNSLVDKNGIIRITDIYDDVPPVTKEQKKFFKSIHFSVRDFQQEIGATELQVNEDKASILMRLWRQPSLTIHGIQGAFSHPGTKNIIPGKVTGKFSINLVPNMSPSKVKKKVVDYFAKLWKARKSANKIRVQMTTGKLFWYTDPSDMNVVAAKNAVAKVYCSEPDLIREPNRVRMANVLRKLTGASLVIIPIGKSNDISGTDSEKLDVMNYINGCKIFTAYMKYLADLFPRVKTPEETKCTCKITGQLESCKCYMQYIPPSEGETDNRLSTDWLMSLMDSDSKPEYRYYYLSLLAMKRMQKLQEVISISHLAPIGSTALSARPAESQEHQQEIRSSLQMKTSRAALASFSVSNLHDVSKPRTGGWLPKRVSTAKDEPETSTLDSADSDTLRPPESSTRVIPQGGQLMAQSSTAALQPTVFSFRVAQSLKRDKSRPFNPANHQVLKAIRSVSPKPSTKVLGKDEGASKSQGAIPARETSSKPAQAVKIKTQTLKASSKSAPDLLTKSQKLKGDPSTITVNSDVLHPNVKRSINPVDVMSSTSRILYAKRLKKKRTASTESLISLSFQMQPSSKKIVRHTETDAASKHTETGSVVQSESGSSVQIKPEIGSPGSPIKSYAVVSSLSNVMYEKRMAKERTDSMNGMTSENQSEAGSTKKMFSEPSQNPKANSPEGQSVAGSIANSTTSPMTISVTGSAASPPASHALSLAGSLPSSPVANSQPEQPEQVTKSKVKNQVEEESAMTKK